MGPMVSFDPAGIALVALLVALYIRAVTVLRWRGYRVPRGQQACWYAGISLIAFALLYLAASVAGGIAAAALGYYAGRAVTA